MDAFNRADHKLSLRTPAGAHIFLRLRTSGCRVVKAKELKADMHGAVVRHAMPFNNVIFQYSFKLEGARMTTLSINTAKGHLCRVLVNPTGFTVQKDDSDHDGPDNAARLETQAGKFNSGERWSWKLTARKCWQAWTESTSLTVRTKQLTR
jgi:hypothetical protein